MLGIALRLAYTLSAGTQDLLAGTRLRVEGSRLVLLLRENSGVFAGESVIRRLERLAQALGLQAAVGSRSGRGSGVNLLRCLIIYRLNCRSGLGASSIPGLIIQLPPRASIIGTKPTGRTSP